MTLEKNTHDINLHWNKNEFLVVYPEKSFFVLPSAFWNRLLRSFLCTKEGTEHVQIYFVKKGAMKIVLKIGFVLWHFQLMQFTKEWSKYINFCGGENGAGKIEMTVNYVFRDFNSIHC